MTTIRFRTIMHSTVTIRNRTNVGGNVKERSIETILWEYNTIFKENNELYRGVAKALGLPDTAFWILYALRDSNGSATQREVCSMLYEPKQTVNSALKKLESEGYIELIPGTDRRSKLIKLTEKGMDLAGQTADKVIETEHRALYKMKEQDREEFLRLFRTYTENLKEEMEDSGLWKQNCSEKMKGAANK